MTEPAATPRVVGRAVLRDYPLRLWRQQQEHMDAVMREFMLLLSSHESADATVEAPRQLLDLAEMFTRQFGALISGINNVREEALARGEDRLDSEVPLVENTPELMAHVKHVLTAVDEFCRRGELLTLARPPELVALSEWSLSELSAQYEGAEPTAWPGPF